RGRLLASHEALARAERVLLLDRTSAALAAAIGAELRTASDLIPAHTTPRFTTP
ncbi:MAG: hypothetical protein HOP99_07770, partial [Dermatophilaceae bacterium]|nr:hypothetical protein [Dermatophilaceae bacterium]